MSFPASFRIMVQRSHRGRDVLIKELIEHNALVEPIILYDVCPTTKDPSYIKDELSNGKIDVICFKMGYPITF